MQVRIDKIGDIETIFRIFLCKHKKYEWFIKYLCGDTIERIALDTHFSDYMIKAKGFDDHINYEIFKELDGIWYGKIYHKDIIKMN